MPRKVENANECPLEYAISINSNNYCEIRRFFEEVKDPTYGLGSFRKDIFSEKLQKNIYLDEYTTMRFTGTAAVFYLTTYDDAIRSILRKDLKDISAQYPHLVFDLFLFHSNWTSRIAVETIDDYKKWINDDMLLMESPKRMISSSVRRYINGEHVRFNNYTLNRVGVLTI